jgi:hypothetical protein
MDQSLFAAPHGLSQRITSFIACACQGIHQLPFFHLIVLIANDHHSISSRTQSRERSQTFDILRHPIKGSDVIRPASRDMRTDARSGNINQAGHQRSPKASTTIQPMTGKVLSNSSRMSSLHDLVKNRPFIPKYEVQTCFFLSKDNHSSRHPRCLYNTEVVELSGIEPLTPCLQSRCSPS